MLDIAAVIRVDANLILSWTFNKTDISEYREDDVVLRFKYADSIGQIYRFDFTKKCLRMCFVENHKLIIRDTEYNDITIECFWLSPVVITG